MLKHAPVMDLIVVDIKSHHQSQEWGLEEPVTGLVVTEENLNRGTPSVQQLNGAIGVLVAIRVVLERRYMVSNLLINSYNVLLAELFDFREGLDSLSCPSLPIEGVT